MDLFIFALTEISFKASCRRKANDKNQIMNLYKTKQRGKIQCTTLRKRISQMIYTIFLGLFTCFYFYSSGVYHLLLIDYCVSLLVCGLLHTLALGMNIFTILGSCFMKRSDFFLSMEIYKQYIYKKHKKNTMYTLILQVDMKRIFAYKMGKKTESFSFELKCNNLNDNIYISKCDLSKIHVMY